MPLHAINAWLIAAAALFALHEPRWASVAYAVLTTVNAVLWLARAGSRRDVAAIICNVPVLMAVTTGYVLVVSLYFAWQADVPLWWGAAETAAHAANFLIASSLVTRSQNLRPLCVALTTAGVVLCLEGVGFMLARTPDAGWLFTPARFFHRPEFQHGEIRLGSGILPWAGVVASALLVFSALSLGLVASARRGRERAIWIAAYALLCVGIFLTGTRAALILLAFMTLAFLARRPGRQRLLAAGTAGLLAALILWMAVLPRSPIRGDGSLRGRLAMWKLSVQVAREHPLTGAGPKAFREAWPAYGRAHGYGHDFVDPHSLVFGLLVDGGLLLLGAVTLLAGSVGWRVWRLMRQPLPGETKLLLFALTLGIGTALLHDIVESAFRSRGLQLLAVILAGVVIGLKDRPRPETQDHSVLWAGTTYRSG